MKSNNSYLNGLNKGIPIALGYLSVSFGFGITSVGKGLTGLQAILISMTNLTSAGQIAGIGIIAACGTLIEMLLSQFVINIRYCLMGIALSQKLDKTFTTLHRLIASFGITDEVFAVAASENGLIGRRFMYGLITLPYIGWTVGTMLGAYAGYVLPDSVCSALGIAIYSMFIAIIVPPSKTDRGVLAAVLISSAMSCCFRYISCFKSISQGFSIIICAFATSALMALIAPKKEEEDE